MLPQLERRALKNGDRLFIDDLEIQVLLADSPMSLAVEDDAFRPAAGALGGGPARSALGASGAALDPLLNLPGGRSATPTTPEVPWNASSSLADHFTPPRTTTPRALPVAEDWDDAGLDRAPARSKAPLQVVPPARDPVAPVAPVAPAAGVGTPSSIDRNTAGFSGAQTQTRPAIGPTSEAGFDISPLLQALGVDPSTLAPGARETLAVSVRSVLQGLIDVLRARAEFRNQFRLQDTRITLTENNPLKFAINAQDALGSLFGGPNPGYMSAPDALDDAFDDMRCHQLATLAGMRAGFESLLARFDPEVLQQRFDRHLKRAGFLAVGAKLRYWDLYTEIFEDLSADRNSAFQRLFGEAFAAAYEKQLDAAQKGTR